MNKQTCHECGHEMVRDIRARTINYKGLSTVIQMPALYCTNCSEALVSGKDHIIRDSALNRLKAQYAGLLLPEEIKRIRKKLNLTQVQASLRLGGGPNSFQKYESAFGLPSQAICNILRILDANPAALEYIPIAPQSGLIPGTTDELVNNWSIESVKGTTKGHNTKTKHGLVSVG